MISNLISLFFAICLFCEIFLSKDKTEESIVDGVKIIMISTIALVLTNFIAVFWPF